MCNMKAISTPGKLPANPTNTNTDGRLGLHNSSVVTRQAKVFLWFK